MPQQAEEGRWHHLRRCWLNPRRVRFWVVALLLLYTLAGFLGLPPLLRSVAIDTAREDYGRDLRIADVAFNPYTFTLRIDALELDDTDGEPLLGFERLLVDFTLLSLFNRAWTFEAIHLDKPWLRERRFADGETRIGRLARDVAPPGAEAEAPADEPGADEGVPRLVVDDLRLRDGQVRFVDEVPAERVELELDPVSITISRLDTRPERQGSQTVRMALESGGTLDWEGSLQLVPFRSRGRIELEGVVLDRLVPYLRQTVPIEDLQLEFDAALDYSAGLAPEGPVFEISNGSVEARQLAVTAFEPATEFLRVEAIRLAGLGYEHAARRVRLESLRIDAPRLQTWLTPAGEPALLQLIPAQEDGGAAGADDPAAKPLSLQLSELRVEGLDVDFEDRTVEPGAAIGLRGVRLGVENFNLEEGAEFPARLSGALAAGGSFDFDGSLAIRPDFGLAGDLRVDGLALAAGEPYLAELARVRFAGGSLDLDGELGIGADEPLSYDGSLSVDALDVVTAQREERVLAWQALRVEELQFGLAARRMRTSVVEIEQPFANIVIAEDQSTNIGRLLVEGEGDAAEAEAGGDDDGGFGLSVDGIAVSSAGLAFADNSLPLPFSTRVRSLDGRVSTLDSATAEPATVEMEGQVGEHGLARVSGAINAWQPAEHTDIGLEFRNLEMPEYSPYTAQFAGRRIAGGRMDLDLRYRIDAGRLEGSNDIVLRDLELGEKVEVPDAASLPLGLAVALLKDSNGVIDIELPVSGDVNDPEFAIGGVIRTALATLIKDIVSSPFRFLGSLLGVGGEDLGRIEFLPGRSDLTPPQREQAGLLARALAQRPQLALEVAGTWDPALDRPALQRQQARAELRRRLQEQGAEATDLTLTDPEAREIVREMFLEAHPDTDIEAVREGFVRPPEDDPDAEPRLDAVAYQAHLAREVVAARDVGRDELETLATARAEAVKALLVGVADNGGDAPAIAPGRVRLGEPHEVEGGKDERVALELSPATG